MPIHIHSSTSGRIHLFFWISIIVHQHTWLLDDGCRGGLSAPVVGDYKARKLTNFHTDTRDARKIMLHWKNLGEFSQFVYNVSINKTKLIHTIQGGDMRLPDNAIDEWALKYSLPFSSSRRFKQAAFGLRLRSKRHTMGTKGHAEDNSKTWHKISTQIGQT